MCPLSRNRKDTPKTHQPRCASKTPLPPKQAQPNMPSTNQALRPPPKTSAEVLPKDPEYIGQQNGNHITEPSKKTLSKMFAASTLEGYSPNTPPEDTSIQPTALQKPKTSPNTHFPRSPQKRHPPKGIRDPHRLVFACLRSTVPKRDPCDTECNESKGPGDAKGQSQRQACLEATWRAERCKAKGVTPTRANTNRCPEVSCCTSASPQRRYYDDGPYLRLKTQNTFQKRSLVVDVFFQFGQHGSCFLHYFNVSLSPHLSSCALLASSFVSSWNQSFGGICVSDRTSFSFSWVWTNERIVHPRWASVWQKQQPGLPHQQDTLCNGELQMDLTKSWHGSNFLRVAFSRGFRIFDAD